MYRLEPTIALCCVLFAAGPTRATSEEICRPTLAAKSSGHSEVANFQRRWTAVFVTDASRCSAASGAFEIEAVRLKEIGPDLSFRQPFAWMVGETEVTVDLTSDEWIHSYRVSDTAPCACRR